MLLKIIAYLLEKWFLSKLHPGIYQILIRFNSHFRMQIKNMNHTKELMSGNTTFDLN